MVISAGVPVGNCYKNLQWFQGSKISYPDLLLLVASDCIKFGEHERVWGLLQNPIVIG